MNDLAADLTGVEGRLNRLESLLESLILEVWKKLVELAEVASRLS